MSALLDDDQITKALGELDGWEVADGKLHHSFEFSDFVQAFGFMTQVALVAEKLDHHPDWSNSWNTVDVSIVNHAAGGITERCVDLARRIDSLPR